MKRNPNIWSANHGKDNFIPEYPDYSMFSLIKETADKYPDCDAIDFQNKKFFGTAHFIILTSLTRQISLLF